jgi:CubicO group peptidase (beta-lactamase class C family)
MTDLADLRLRRRIDALLAPWDRAGPGVTIGVVRDGHLILHRSTGLASLELGASIGEATTFRIASVSKQFTCAAILMLAAEGKLHVEDDARAVLPELPDLGTPITIAHLMHNTSGIRDMLEIMRMGGADLGQTVTPADLLAGICRQRGLNFDPGSRYLYSNSNFFLLGLIVERLSGEALPEFLQHRIFAPLGMTMTRMTPDTAAPTPGLATGYIPAGKEWRRARHGFPLGGEGGLVSSVIDLALWDMNYVGHFVGGPSLAAELETLAPFTNGTSNTYARGLQISSHRGIRTVSHGGLWPGYKTQFLRAPEAKTTIIVITNDGGADPWHLAHHVLDAALDGHAILAAPVPLPNKTTLEALVGRWVDAARGATVDVHLNDDGVPIGNTYGVPFRLRPEADGRLVADRPSKDFAARLSDDAETLAVELDAGAMATYCRAPAQAALPAGLAGTYANAEMAATWTLSMDGDAMRVHVSGPIVTTQTWRAIPVSGDLIRIVSPRMLFESWIDTVVLRDATGSVTGLRADGGRARGVIFARINEREAA